MIKNIIFDFGGVILKHRKSIMEEFISKMFNVPIDQALEVWKRHRQEITTGKTTSAILLSKLKNRFNSRKSVNELIKTWKVLYKKEADNVNWELLNLIEQLKKEYKVYLFTETIDLHDEYNRNRNIYNKFHQIFKSFEEKLIKTDEAAFYNVLKQIHAKPEECLFIDDLEANVNRAEEIGIKSILYKNNSQLFKELKNIVQN